ncbi:hypothetical protein [Synechococcus lacustris]|uniref:hypothetical protein n=1 Tax=Synechococcus lacustris TaxID=2116544 RepID=UPI001F4DC3EE|nr:hypothetical protein [Synechococcus lacustris]
MLALAGEANDHCGTPHPPDHPKQADDLEFQALPDAHNSKNPNALGYKEANY